MNFTLVDSQLIKQDGKKRFLSCSTSLSIQIFFSFDFIFSNWLLMYLSDEELKSFFERMLSWLKPGGFLFFRESCNHRSGSQHTTKHHHHHNI